MFAYALENPILPIVFVALFSMLIFSVVGAKFRQYQEVDVQGAVALMNDDDFTLLDIREPKERQSGHINHDMHIPMAQVKSKLNTLAKDKPVLVYCRSGTRSANIAQVLGKAEFNVYSLKGGFNAWLSANMPITKNKSNT